jgi:hypothetical protein
MPNNIKKEMCCELCYSDGRFTDVGCCNKKCSCHTAPQEECGMHIIAGHSWCAEPYPCKMHGKWKDIKITFTSTTIIPQEEWEKEFDKEFSDMLNFIEAQTGESERVRLKSFIKKIRDEAYKEGRKYTLDDLLKQAGKAKEIARQDTINSIKDRLGEMKQEEINTKDPGYKPEGMYEDKQWKILEMLNVKTYGYNQALHDILTLLDKEL